MRRFWTWLGGFTETGNLGWAFTPVGAFVVVMALAAFVLIVLSAAVWPGNG